MENMHTEQQHSSWLVNISYKKKGKRRKGEREEGKRGGEKGGGEGIMC